MCFLVGILRPEFISAFFLSMQRVTYSCSLDVTHLQPAIVPADYEERFLEAFCIVFQQLFEKLLACL